MQARLVTMVAVLLLAAFSESAMSQAASDKSLFWPQHHGPGRTNMSSDTGLLKRWPKSGPRKLWTYSPCGRGYSGVAIAEGMIFTAGDRDRQEQLIALDMDGNFIWKAPNGDAWRRSSPGSRATPTYSDGVLYHMNPTGRIAAYQSRSGKELWAVDLKERFDATYGIWALSENIIVDGGKVICMPGGPTGRVVALDKNTGKTIWANTEIDDYAAYCSGTIVDYAGRRQLLTMTQRSVVGVAIDDGGLIWSAPFRPASPQNALTPVFDDGNVFVACGHSSGGTLMKLDLPARTASTVWHRQDLDDCHSGAMLIDGRLYGSSCRTSGSTFYCVDFLTGKTIKTDETLGKVGITCAEGMIYALNHQGTMYLLDLTDDGFEIVSQFVIERKGANNYLAHPVVCGRRLYIRSHDDLHVYDIAAN